MKHAILTAAIAACVAAPLGAATLADTYTSYFAFGDSLTDDGKFFPFTTAPSFEGRFSNGETYAEIIAGDFAVSGNYALGGATAGPVNLNAPYTNPALNAYATLGDQVTTFIASGDAGSAGANPLVSILMGSNDIFQNAFDPLFDVTDTVDHLIDAIYAIAGLGPFDDFVVPLTPGATGPSPFAPLRQDFNAYFLSRLAGLEADGINIIVPDFDAASARIAADPLAFGITTIGACAPTFFGPDDAENCTFTGYDEFGNPQYDLSLADAYTLADPVHPSATVHAEWANEFSAAVLSDIAAPVPLPGTGLLLLGGIAALGMRRRKAA